jgi:heme A synthase
MIEFGLYATYALLGISVLMILVFSISKIAGDPAGAKTGIIGLVGLAALLGISYVLSTGDDATTLFEKLNITEGTSHYVGAALFSFYLLGALTILAIIFAEVNRLFK